MVNGIMGGDVPAQKYLAGAGLGAMLSLFQPGLGITVGLGFYLPFNIVLTYSIGTATAEWLTDYKFGQSFAENSEFRSPQDLLSVKRWSAWASPSP